jgi:hypothetical protein
MRHLKLSSTSILIVLVLLLSTAGNVTAEGPSQPNQGSQTETAAQDQSAIVSPSPTRFDQQAATPVPACGATNINHQSGQSSPNANLASWAEAIATIGLLLFASFQIGFIRRSTRATEDAAKAASDNARAAKDAAIATERYVEMTEQMVEATKQSAKAAALALNAERPYLFVENRNLRYIPKETFLSMVDPTVKTQRTHVLFTFALHNFGKGVAVVNSVRVRLVVRSGPRVDVEPLPVFPITIAKDSANRPKTRIIGADKIGDQWAEDLDVPNAIWRDILESRLTLIIVAFIKYQDVFRRFYTTRFTATYIPPFKSPDPEIPIQDGILWPSTDRHNRFT